MSLDRVPFLVCLPLGFSGPEASERCLALLEISRVGDFHGNFTVEKEGKGKGKRARASSLVVFRGSTIPMEILRRRKRR